MLEFQAKLFLNVKNSKDERFEILKHHILVMFLIINKYISAKFSIKLSGF